MPHALAAFITERMDERGLRQRDIVAKSGLSRALVSKYAADDRDKLTRLPDKATLDGFAKSLGVSSDFLLGKAIEALNIGYAAGDFINSVGTATDDELLDEVRRRLTERGEGHAGPAPMTPDDGDPGAAIVDFPQPIANEDSAVAADDQAADIDVEAEEQERST